MAFTWNQKRDIFVAEITGTTFCEQDFVQHLVPPAFLGPFDRPPGFPSSAQVVTPNPATAPGLFLHWPAPWKGHSEKWRT